MPREKNQKIKIVRICDLLRNARGIDNALTTAGLISMLADEDIPCDRRTLADDIKVSVTRDQVQLLVIKSVQ